MPPESIQSAEHSSFSPCTNARPAVGHIPAARKLGLLLEFPMAVVAEVGFRDGVLDDRGCVRASAIGARRSWLSVIPINLTACNGLQLVVGQRDSLSFGKVNDVWGVLQSFIFSSCPGAKSKACILDLRLSDVHAHTSHRHCTKSHAAQTMPRLSI